MDAGDSIALAQAHPGALAPVPTLDAVARSLLAAWTAAAAVGCGSSLALLVLGAMQKGGDRLVIVALAACTLAAAGFAARARARAATVIAQLREASRTDPLTGLLNRRGFEQLMDVALARATRAARPLALLAADLDHFKALNDRRGHAEGDRALRAFAAVAIAASRRIDMLARVGGEEFAMLLPDTDHAGAEQLAQRLRDAFASAGDHADWPTVSFGLTSFPSLATDRETLTLTADQALYVAKALGRDRCVTYDDTLANVLREPSGEPGSDELATALSMQERLAFRARAEDHGGASRSPASSPAQSNSEISA